MSNILVRGIPKRIHNRIQKIAKLQNLSINQTLIQLITAAIEEQKDKRETEKERTEVFERVRRLRNEIRKKYGTFDDSTKLIREDRDSR